ncbi:hypothetical protein EMIHUDRAFT_453462 [Emiliania huxleyi CCMP1516]|uniref:Uncharacterized protein n=2 Tax=Emiliania huxleyi TaxID=2903 RepID=A0A0D3I513_EMIH1|nr:hypothetical protein EMIHUDRAFT_453462 [Emiliania huxleyi CCMP1516]EOD06348.1 hypothetical protein EMIHUDRAFT_453462 [Emiliania huxleyi CCMP1516]|eukprot:XP_005758777.1 hypothetical protein EMIHUDRAFT_453462 [Emiliania huxleyi CCMP1516]
MGDSAASAIAEAAAAKEEVEKYKGYVKDMRRRLAMVGGNVPPSSLDVYEEMLPLVENDIWQTGQSGWLTADPGQGLAPPKENEILPLFLLSPAAAEYAADSSRYELFDSGFFPLWGIYMGCSRKFADLALIELTGFDKADVVPSVDGVPPEQQALPFRAVWEPGNTLEKERAETLNTPYPFPVPFPGRSRSTIILNWLGCRCSWPMTQFMWWNCISCNMHQVAVMIWMPVSVLFEWILLDGLFDIEFISKVPDGGGKLHSKLIHWEDYLLSKHPVAQKAATLLIYFIFPFIVLGYIASSGLTAWFRSLYQGRMMLRSLAARREANNEAYCSLLWFAIWVEVHSVVIPAYIPFIGPATFVFHYGANLVQLAKYYVILDVIIKFQQISLWFVHWLFCLTPDQINVTTQYYAGKRAVDEMDAAFYLYMWSFWVVMIGNMVGWGFELGYLWQWSVPALILLYAFFLHSFPYCFAGQAICPPHTEAAVRCIMISTTFVFLLIHISWRACFLFPCLCAPEVPGWLFFPPHDPPPNPLKGQIIDLYGFRVFLDKLANGFAMPDDCVWEPVR